MGVRGSGRGQHQLPPGAERVRAGVVLGRLWLARPGRRGTVPLGHGTVAPAVLTAGPTVAAVLVLVVAARSVGVVAAVVVGSVSMVGTALLTITSTDPVTVSQLDESVGVKVAST